MEITDLDPVVQRPISLNPGLNFNSSFFFVCSKAIPRIIFSQVFLECSVTCLKYRCSSWFDWFIWRGSLNRKAARQGLHEFSTFNAAFLLVVSIHVVSMGGGSSSLRELKDKKHFNIMIIIIIILCTSVPSALFQSTFQVKRYPKIFTVHQFE